MRKRGGETVDHSTLDGIMKRLDRLERQARLWKICAGGAALVCAFMLLLGANSAKTVEELRARRFVVVDQSGNSVGEFSALEGSSALMLSDATGAPRVVLSYGYDTPAGLSLRDGKRATRADLSLRLDNSVALDLFDKEGRLRATMGINSDGIPQATFQDQSGNSRRTP